MFIENTEELAQNKLLLLYIIIKAPTDFTNTSLSEFILKKNYMNYFLTQQYLAELISSEFIEQIEKDEDSIYKILEKGKVILDYFEDRIPEKIKEELDNDFYKKEIEIKRETQVIAEHFLKESNQHVVNLKLVENEETLLSLYINVPNIKQAEIICNSWKNNTELIYKKLINMLVNDSLIEIE